MEHKYTVELTAEEMDMLRKACFFAAVYYEERCDNEPVAQCDALHEKLRHIQIEQTPTKRVPVTVWLVEAETSPCRWERERVRFNTKEEAERYRAKLHRDTGYRTRKFSCQITKEVPVTYEQ